MFPQPWLPTKAFPHPMSGLSYQHSWTAQNYLSYQMVDNMLWVSLKPIINEFRQQVLKLKPILMGQGGHNILTSHRIPFAKMWSPAFVPKPKDWPDNVDIVGTFFDSPPKSNSEKSTSQEQTYKPNDALAAFLSDGPPPLFVGFGSMMIEDPESLIMLFLQACAILRVRVLIQSGWSDISPEKFRQMAEHAQQLAKKMELAEEEWSSDDDISSKDTQNNSSNNDDEDFEIVDSNSVSDQRGWIKNSAASLTSGINTFYNIAGNVCLFFLNFSNIHRYLTFVVLLLFMCVHW